MKAKELKDEYVFTANQVRAVLQTFVNTFTIAVSGVVIAIIMAADKYPSSGPVFLIFPLLIVGWYIMMDLQGKEIYARSRYLAILEKRIQIATGDPFPCAESRILPHLYLTWRYAPLFALVGAPIVLMYIFVTCKALTYLVTKAPSLRLPALAFYVACPVLAVILMQLSVRAINRELIALKTAFGASEKNVQPPAGGDSSTRADAGLGTPQQ